MRTGSCGKVWMVAVVLAVTVAACGGNDSTPTSPTPPTDGGGGGTQGTTITIGANGVMNPPVLTVSPGTRVTFMNNDSRSRQIESDPHPSHEDCPEINQVGSLATGQSKQTGNLNTVRTCGYHDHNEPSVRGSIRIQ